MLGPFVADALALIQNLPPVVSQCLHAEAAHAMSQLDDLGQGEHVDSFLLRQFQRDGRLRRGRREEGLFIIVEEVDGIIAGNVAGNLGVQRKGP